MSRLVLDSSRFQNWKRSLESKGASIENINVVGEVSRDGSTLYTALIDCLLKTPEGVSIPRCVVLQGNSIVVIPVLTCSDDKTIYTLLVKQRRISDGDFTTEFPAGSLEADDDPLIMAIRELKEELGLTVSENELVPLNQKQIEIAPGILYAMIHYYYFERSVTRSFLEEIEGRITGCHSEFEFIHVKVLKMSEVCSNVSNTYSLAGIKLLEHKLGKVFH